MGETKREVQIKRIYAEADSSDGFRILIDRLWPRGISKERAELDLWDKDIAPSPGLRAWWDHDPQRMKDFANRYRAELDGNPDAVDRLLGILHEHAAVTLLYAAHDPQVNHALILKQYLEDRV